MNEQLGLTLRDEGMKLALGNAAEWAQDARAYVIALEHGTCLTSEDVIAMVGLPHGSETNANNAVGALMSGLARQGWIQRVGYAPATRPVSHGRVLALWERL